VPDSSRGKCQSESGLWVRRFSHQGCRAANKYDDTFDLTRPDRADTIATSPYVQPPLDDSDLAEADEMFAGWPLCGLRPARAAEVPTATDLVLLVPSMCA